MDDKAIFYRKNLAGRVEVFLSTPARLGRGAVPPRRYGSKKVHKGVRRLGRTTGSREGCLRRKI